MRVAKLQQNYIKKGRGKGTGSDYSPFIQAIKTLESVVETVEQFQKRRIIKKLKSCIEGKVGYYIGRLKGQLD